MDDLRGDRKWPWEPKRDRRVLFAVGWMAVGGVVTLIGCAFLFFVFVIVGMMTGFLPAPEAVPGKDLSWRSRGFLKDRHLIEEGETLIYFDSVGTSGASEDGNLFTDRRVVRYHEDPAEERGLFVSRIDYADIESIEPVFGHGSHATTVIRVTPKEGDAFDLLVTNEEGGDRAFAKRLQETWRSRREPSGGAEAK